MAGKAKKVLGGILIAAVLLVVVLVCTFLFWLGPTVKMVAEHVGSKALGTPLAINELRINPRDGTLHMSGFTIANYNMFGRTNTVGIASMDIALDVGSIFSPTVTVHKVQIDSPHFVYEQNEANDNISEYIRNIEAYLGIDPDHPQKPRPIEIEEENEASEPKYVIVEQLEINDMLFYLVNTEEPSLDIEVGLEQLTVSMTNGTVGLKNFHVSNPQLLETPNLFTLDRIDIDVDPASIYSDRLSIRDIQVIRPYAYLELNRQTDTVAEFMQIAKSLANAALIQAEPIEETVEETVEEIPIPTEPAPAVLPVELHNLLVDDIQVKLLDLTKEHSAKDPRMLAGIESVSASLTDGRIQIEGIAIPNMEGYSASNLFHLAGIGIAIDPDSVFSEQVRITEVRIDSPEINLQQTETSGNVIDLQAQLMAFVPATTSESPPPAPETEPAEEPKPVPLSEQPVLLHRLVVTNVLVNLEVPESTNQASWSIQAADYGKLNPLKQLPLGGDEDDEEPEFDPDAPLPLLALEMLSIQPLKGLVDVKQLKIANPPGYTRRHLIKLESLHCELDPDTLQSDTMLIRDLVISGPHVRYERHIMSDNFKSLQEEVGNAIARREEELKSRKIIADEEEAEPEKKDEDGQKVILDRVLIEGSTVQARLSALPATPPLPLPRIELTEIGREKGGATPVEATTEVFETFYDSMLSTVGDSTGFATDALKGIGGLTLETVGLKKKDTAETESDIPPEETTEPTPDEDEKTETKPKKRSFFHRHRGRLF